MPNLKSGTSFFVRKGSKEAEVSGCCDSIYIQEQSTPRVTNLQCHTRGGPIRLSLDYHVTFGYNAKDDTLTMDHCGCDGPEGGKGVMVCEYEDGGDRLDCVGKNTHDPNC